MSTHLLHRIRQRYAPLSIRYKLMISFFLVLLAALLSMSAWYADRTTRYVQADRQRNFEELMHQATISVDHIITSVEEAGKSILLNQTLEDILQYTGTEQYPLAKQLDDYFTLSKYINVAHVNENIREIHLYFAIHSIYARQRHYLFHIEDAKGKPWYQHAIAASGAPVWGYRPEEIACVRAMVRYERPESEAGFLEILLDAGVLRQIMDGVSGATGGNVCLVDESGHAFFERGDGPLFLALVEKHWKTLPTDASPVSVSDADALLLRRRLSNGWYIVASQPFSVIGAEVQRMSWDVLWIGVLSFFLSVLIITLLTRNLLRRVRDMATFMSTVDILTGDEYRTEATPGDELTVMETSFNSMLRTARESIHKENEALRQKKEADFIVLQEQINPHFLYNCLDSINWLAIEHHADEISTMTSLLSRFFRLGLGRGNQIVPLKDELTHVALYVEIIKMRFDGQLSVAFEVDDALLDVLTLKFILQPLVENAIVHGIGERPNQSGKVRVAAIRQGARLLLTVTDDGVGIPPERLQELRRAETGYGLFNVHQRIRLHFGDDYGMQMESTLGAGTTVTLSLPIAIPREQ